MAAVHEAKPSPSYLGRYRGHLHVLNFLLYSKAYHKLEDDAIAQDHKLAAKRERLLTAQVLREQHDIALKNEISFMNAKVDVAVEKLNNGLIELKPLAFSRLLEAHNTELEKHLKVLLANNVNEDEGSDDDSRMDTSTCVISPPSKRARPTSTSKAPPRPLLLLGDDGDDSMSMAAFVSSFVKTKLGEVLQSQLSQQRAEMRQSLMREMDQVVNERLKVAVMQLRMEYEDKLQDEKDKIRLLLELEQEAQCAQIREECAREKQEAVEDVMRRVGLA